MSRSIVIDKKSYTCTKKKLKKSLEAKGVSFTLSEVSDILAQSFGFKNEFDMQKNYFNSNHRELENLLSLNPSIDTSNPFDRPLKSKLFVADIAPASKGVVDIIGRNRSFVNIEKVISAIKLNDLKGNIVVTGATGSGVSHLVSSILANSNKKDLRTINKNHNEKGSFGYARKKGDLKNVPLLNKEGENFIFGVYGNSKNEALGNIGQIEPNFILDSIDYIVLTKFEEMKQQVIIYDMKNLKEIHVKNERKKLKSLIIKDKIIVVDKLYDDDNVSVIKKSLEENNKILTDRLLRKIDFNKLKGNIVITGQPGRGIATIISSIIEQKPKNLVTINESDDVYFGFLEKSSDLKKVNHLNEKNTNVIFGVYTKLPEEVFDKINSTDPDFNTESISYIVNIDKDNEIKTVSLYTAR